MDSDNLVVSFENSFRNEVAEFTGEMAEFVSKRSTISTIK